MHLGGRPDLRARTSAAGRILQADRDPDEIRAGLASNQDAKVTALLQYSTGTVEAVEGTIRSTGEDGGRPVLITKGSSTRGFYIDGRDAPAVLAWKDGYGGQEHLANVYRRAEESVPELEESHFEDIPVHDGNGEPPSSVQAAFVLTHPGFDGDQDGRGCVFFATDRDPEEIVNGYFVCPPRSSMTSEHGSFTTDQLSPGAGVSQVSDPASSASLTRCAWATSPTTTGTPTWPRLGTLCEPHRLDRLPSAPGASSRGGGRQAGPVLMSGMTHRSSLFTDDCGIGWDPNLGCRVIADPHAPPAARRRALRQRRMTVGGHTLTVRSVMASFSAFALVLIAGSEVGIPLGADMLVAGVGSGAAFAGSGIYWDRRWPKARLLKVPFSFSKLIDRAVRDARYWDDQTRTRLAAAFTEAIWAAADNDPDSERGLVVSTVGVLRLLIDKADPTTDPIELRSVSEALDWQRSRDDALDDLRRRRRRRDGPSA